MKNPSSAPLALPAGNNKFKERTGIVIRRCPFPTSQHLDIATIKERVSSYTEAKEAKKDPTSAHKPIYLFLRLN